MRTDNASQLRAAAQRRSQETSARAAAALDRLAADGEHVTVASVAAAARVSRSWLYTQPAVLERIDEISSQRPRSARHAAPVGAERASTTSLQRRLELAHQRIRQITDENRRLRDELARAYAELRSGQEKLSR